MWHVFVMGVSTIRALSLSVAPLQFFEQGGVEWGELVDGPEKCCFIASYSFELERGAQHMSIEETLG